MRLCANLWADKGAPAATVRFRLPLSVCHITHRMPPPRLPSCLQFDRLVPAWSDLRLLNTLFAGCWLLPLLLYCQFGMHTVILQNQGCAIAC